MKIYNDGRKGYLKRHIDFIVNNINYILEFESEILELSELTSSNLQKILDFDPNTLAKYPCNHFLKKQLSPKQYIQNLTMVIENSSELKDLLISLEDISDITEVKKLGYPFLEDWPKMTDSDVITGFLMHKSGIENYEISTMLNHLERLIISKYLDLTEIMILDESPFSGLVDNSCLVYLPPPNKRGHCGGLSKLIQYANFNEEKGLMRESLNEARTPYRQEWFVYLEPKEIINEITGSKPDIETFKEIIFKEEASITQSDSIGKYIGIIEPYQTGVRKLHFGYSEDYYYTLAASKVVSKSIDRKMLLCKIIEVNSIY